MTTLWSWLTARLAGAWGYIAAAAGAVAVLLYALSAARKAGRDDALAQQKDQALRNSRIRDNVEDRIRRTGDGTAADELRRHWRRD